MKRLLATLTMALLVSFVLATVASGAPGAGGGNNDSASGTVNQFGQQETFSAKSSSIGTNAQGSWKETSTNTDPNQVITGEIRCLRVSTSPVPGVGALFEARGVIVDVRNASPFFNAQGFVLRGSDSGKFSTSSDTYFSQLTLAPQLEDSCAAPTTGSPVADGEIIVKDAV
jgi:hypothetical protein